MGKQQSEWQRSDVTALVDDILARNLAARATDVHFEPVDDGMLIRARVDGQLVDRELLPSGLSVNIVSRLKVLASLLTYRVDIPQEGSFLWQGNSVDPSERPVDVRVATIPTVRGERAVVRIFRGTPQLKSLDSLGLATDQVGMIRAAIAQPAGLIVVSGPAGSGKTTTLYAMIRDLRARFSGRSVITLEDPVEQRIDRVTQIQINPHGELGYERCMRSLLRHDPQAILLGEVRDSQTAFTAIEAALTGHLIFTTVHSGDAAETIVRFLELGIPSYQLTSALSLVCAQRLLRKKCPTCRQRATGECASCLDTGYAGRIAIAQTVSMDERTREQVLRHAPASELRETLSKQCPELIHRAAAVMESGDTDEEEIIRVLGCRPRV